MSDRLRRIYDNIVYNNYSPGIIFNQMLEIVTAIAYVNTYRIMIKLNSKKDDVKYIALLIPVLLFFAMVLVTSDRNIFLRYAIFFLCVYVLFFKENYKKKNANIKIIQRVIIFGIIFLIAFFILGLLKQYKSNLMRVIGIYGGSGLYNFNLWIADFDGPLLYGDATFSTLHNSLNTIFGYLGIDLNLNTLSRFDVFIEYRSANGYVYSSNIYSALKPYVEDFGYFGVILFPFVIGMFYEWFYLRMKTTKYSFSWLAYCMFIYPVIFFPILDQLFGRMTLSLVYEFFWLAVFYYAIFGKWNSKRKMRTLKLKGSVTHGS